MLLGAALPNYNAVTPAASQAAGWVIDATPIQNFLQRILPAPGVNRVISINSPYRKPGVDKPAFPGQGFTSFAEAANHIAYWLGADCRTKGKPATDYYHTMSLQAGAVQGQFRNGRTFLKTSRRQANAVALKAFFLDLDTKAEKGGYTSKADALGALLPLVQDGRVPPPTMIVDSGNGLHVYWTLDREIPAADWTELATGFGNFMWREGLKLHLGDSFFGDSARLLRPPGTYNCKDPENPKLTKIVGKVRDTDYDPALFEKYRGVLPPNHNAKVASLAVVQAQRTVATPGTMPPPLPAAFQRGLAPVQSELAAGIAVPQAEAVDMAKVIERCEVLKDIAARGGNGDPEPLWHLAILASTFVEDGRTWAHALSAADPRYQPADTDAKFDQSMLTRQGRGGAVGWPSCAAFNRHSSKCATCAFAGKVKSPLNTAKDKDDSDLPEGYYRQNGTIWKNLLLSSRKDAEPMPTEVFGYGIQDAFIESTQEGPALNAEILIRNERPQRMRVPLTAINTWRDKIHAIFGAHGITIPKRVSQETQEFFVSFIRQLQQAASMSARRDAFGWTQTRHGVPGFAIGGRIITAGGIGEELGAQDMALASRYEAQGDLSEWKKAAAFIVSSGRVELATILATAFAGPLVKFTGVSGLLVSAYSPRSGVQKSSAMETAMAVWGHPKLAMNRMDDTGNSAANKLGTLRHLPVLWDELQTQDDKDHFVKLAFALTQGTEKSRLTSDIQQRHTGSWATMLVTASNFSVQDEMTRKARNTTAGLNRVLEFVVLPPAAHQQTTLAQANAALSPIQTNYGLAGEVYVRALLRDIGNLPKQLNAAMTALESICGTQPEERFWLWSAATILVGAAIAKREGLVDFDLVAMRQFLVGVIREQRRQKTANALDITGAEYAADVLQRYIAHARKTNACLETDIMQSAAHRGRPPVVQLMMPSEEARKAMRSPVVHIARNEGMVRILCHEFREWLFLEKIPQRPILDSLKEHGGMEHHRITWAAGTEFRGGQAPVYDVILKAGLGPEHRIGNLFDWGLGTGTATPGTV